MYKCIKCMGIATRSTAFTHKVDYYEFPEDRSNGTD